MLFRKRRNPSAANETVEVEVIEPFNDQAAAAAEREQESSGGHTASDAEFELPGEEAAEAAGPARQQRDGQAAHHATKAIGISYDEGDAAPTVSAVGEGEMAQAIIDMANELGIYIHRDINLMTQLENLREGEEVPRDLFVIISTILSFSYLLQGKTPEIFRRDDGSQAVNIRA